MLAVVAGWNLYQYLVTTQCDEFDCVVCGWGRNARAGRIAVAVSAMLVVFTIAVS